MAKPTPEELLRKHAADHSRRWRQNLYVYPVISRRSSGLSIGVNLNPDKACNFDCVYCQVDRTVAPTVRKVDLQVLAAELDDMVAVAAKGDIWNDPQFADVPDAYRRINDIAFSGDGEPTTCPQFTEAVRLAAAARDRHKLTDMKLILITDAAYLNRENVRNGLAVMDANNGEIWAKLDAGTQAYYELINRPNVPLDTVLDNILQASRVRPVVIQSLWMNVRQQPPPSTEIDAFAQRLAHINTEGGRIKLVQIYTIARKTTEEWVTPLTTSQLNEIAERVRSVVDLPMEIYAGSAG